MWVLWIPTQSVVEYLMRVGVPFPKDHVWQEIDLSVNSGKQAVVAGTKPYHSIIVPPYSIDGTPVNYSETHQVAQCVEGATLFWRIPWPLPEAEIQPLLAWGSGSESLNSDADSAK